MKTVNWKLKIFLLAVLFSVFSVLPTNAQQAIAPTLSISPGLVRQTIKPGEKNAVVIDIVHERFGFVHERGHAEIEVVADNETAHSAGTRCDITGNLIEIAEDLPSICVEESGRLIEVGGEAGAFVEKLIIV